MKSFRTRLFTLATATLLTAAAAKAATIYDNSVNDMTTRFNPRTLEVGNEITLGGPERWLTNFDFEYYGLAGAATFAGPVQARVRFYLNDGPLFNNYATPATSFYDSDWFNIGSPTPRNTLLFTAGSDFPSTGLFIPAIANLTWSVQFRGMGLGDEVGLDLFSPPTVGSSFGDYWQNNGSSWSLLVNSGGPMTFGATFQASLTPVPEPGSLALFTLGAFSLLTLRRRRR